MGTIEARESVQAVDENFNHHGVYRKQKCRVAIQLTAAK